MKRRDFLHISISAAGALSVGFHCFEPQKTATTTEIHTFIRLSAANELTILAPRGDIGTGVKTALPMLIAEEMNWDWAQVKVELPEKIDRKYGAQGGGGSYAIRSNYTRLRQVGAAIRELFLEAAAQSWGVSKQDCWTEKGIVFQKNSQKQLRFSDLAAQVAAMPIPANPPLKSPKEFKIIGKPTHDVDAKAIVMGKPLFGSDVRIEGMLYATIAKPPVLGAKILSFDDSKAKGLQGFKGVVKIDPLPNPTHQIGGLAILATSHWAAIEARKRVTVQWDKSSANASSVWLNQQFDRILAASDVPIIKNEGDATTVFDQAARKIEAVYEVPFLAHAAMEPMNFTAYVQADKCELWGSTQVPNAVFRQAKNLLNLPDEAITVHLCRSGGGFGRRLMVDYAIDALLISKQIQQPVQVFWTREDDFTHDYYRPAGKYKVKASLDAAGQVQSWDMKASTVSRFAFRQDTNPAHTTEVNAEQFPAGFVPHFRLAYQHPQTPFPVGAWRAPGDNATAFVVQSIVDELAFIAKKDPIEFRLNWIGNKGILPTQNPEDGFDCQELKAVLQIVKDKSGWGKPLPNGHFQGVACHVTFGVPVAEVVEISYKNQELVIHNVTVAVACGQVVNPNHAEHQVVGAVIDGLGAALYGKITYEKGQVQQTNFHEYRLLRLSEAPSVSVHFLPSNEPPKGLGEMALPPVAPALCNAIFAATGKRIRQLPIVV
jgi:isoquinoline 1-oxidoreductase beta subunit